MPYRYNPIEVSVASGGRLMSNLSDELPGVGDYRVKRDWRRYLDREITREGHDYFWPNTSIPIGTQPFPTTDTITLIHQTRRPNGQRSVEVGSTTDIYRYFGLEDPLYVEAGYFEDPPAANAPYAESNPGNWIRVGRDFSDPAQRWEAVCINGWSIFNNGVDLPVTYRVEELETVPLYEMREAGIASVGCIAELAGILLAGNIAEIDSEKLVDLFDPIGVQRSGATMAKQLGNTVTVPDDYFSAGDVGKTIIFDDQRRKDITAFVDERTVTVDGSAEDLAPQRFMLRIKASQAGSTFSGSISANQANGSFSVIASAAFFSGGMVGKTLRYVNGFSATITVFTDSTHVTVDTAAPDDMVGLSFYIVSQPEEASADFLVTAVADIFDAGMVGRNISWEDGMQRRIVAFVDAKNVYVEADTAIPAGIIGVDNPATYAAFTEKQFINRISYRLIWSMVDLPRRFSPVFKGRMQANTYVLTLDQPAKSIQIGDQLTVSGAGIDGGNLDAIVTYVSADRVIHLDTAASTTVGIEFFDSDGNRQITDPAPVTKTDAVSSIVGYEDLQDDTSGIIRILELGGQLVVYKDTAVVVARYLADIDQPFAFHLRRIPSSHALFYRNTLVMVAGAYHVYAGRESFFAFDLVNQFPSVIVEFEMMKDLFFDVARLENTASIFAADNILTKEIFIALSPQTGDDRVICYDYSSRPGTIATSSMKISAAASVKRPDSGGSTGETEDWFVMGNTDGVVLLYGYLAQAEAVLANAKRIHFRRELAPYSATKIAYSAVLKSGLGHFGSQFNEKDIRAWVILLSGKSRQTPLTFELLVARETQEGETVAGTATVTPPQTMVSLHFRAFYLGDRITVNVLDTPLELVGRIFDVSSVISRSHGRRQLV